MKIYILSSLMPDMDKSGNQFHSWILEGAFSSADRVMAEFDKLRGESPLIPMRVEETEIDSKDAPILVTHYYP